MKKIMLAKLTSPGKIKGIKLVKKTLWVMNKVWP